MKRHLLLVLELTFDLVIFAVCAVVCTGLLVRAHRISADSAQLTDAVYLAQSAAEAWRAGAAVPQGEDGFEVTIEPLAGEQAVSVAVMRDGAELFRLEEVARP